MSNVIVSLSPVAAEKVRAILAGLGAPEGELPEFMMESDFRAVAEVASAIEKAQAVQPTPVAEAAAPQPADVEKMRDAGFAVAQGLKDIMCAADNGEPYTAEELDREFSPLLNRFRRVFGMLNGEAPCDDEMLPEG